ncbi:hypothetical protein GDO86_003195 [Hymenochirus boettgeri]|uniref:Transmembrane protein 183A n=1 Tax=Hymenochirus boettgeri TaxID=247094 RepID=A0A8T2K2I9_9PIPI|nr:hypothetical protein GDO86_003195 [Hymenochirus boettgeri]
MPKKGNRKRLKYRAEDVSSHRVTVADYANSDPALVKSGRIRKSVANAVQKEVKALCGLEASTVPAEEGDFILSENEHSESYDELNNIENLGKKKKKPHKENTTGAETGMNFPIDIWLLLSSYIRPEDVLKFALICKHAWIVTCTAAFWMRLYKRYYQCLLFWYRKAAANRSETMWELNFKLKKQPPKVKNHSLKVLHPPLEYKEVHINPDQDCCLLQVSTLNFIFIPVVMGMTLTYFTINISSDMRHHRVRLVFQDSPVWSGKKPRGDQGVQVVLDPVHSVHLLDWWHPGYPFSSRA